jgi:hypothetical protein
VCVCVCVCVGEVVSLVCSYVATDDSNKPKGSIQWVPASSAVSAEVRWYNHLFTTEEPNDDTWEAELNADSEIVMKSALVSTSGVEVRYHCAQRAISQPGQLQKLGSD